MHTHKHSPEQTRALVNCVVDAVESGDRKVLEDLSVAIDKFFK